MRKLTGALLALIASSPAMATTDYPLPAVISGSTIGCRDRGDLSLLTRNLFSAEADKADQKIVSGACRVVTGEVQILARQGGAELVKLNSDGERVWIPTSAAIVRTKAPRRWQPILRSSPKPRETKSI